MIGIDLFLSGVINITTYVFWKVAILIYLLIPKWHDQGWLGKTSGMAFPVFYEGNWLKLGEPG